MEEIARVAVDFSKVGGRRNHVLKNVWSVNFFVIVNRECLEEAEEVEPICK